MNSAVELKVEISFDEFKAWMNGLLRGKGSQLPNIDDWRVIKNMMDKVVPDTETIVQHTPIYTNPPIHPTWEEPQKYPSVPWCDTTYGGTPKISNIGGYGGYGCYGASNLKITESPGVVGTSATAFGSSNYTNTFSISGTGSSSLAVSHTGTKSG